MDALDIVMNKQRATPYFQPIVSADRQRITGYEVIGQFEKDNGDWISLEPFFDDNSIPEDYRWELADYIREQALKKYLQENRSESLFFNINANVAITKEGEQFFNRLAEFRTAGLPYEKIVLEIKEHQHEGNLSHLKHFIQYIQSLNIKVALDDVGTSSTQLDEIALLHPDIIKVNLNHISSSQFPGIFTDVLHSLSGISRKIGASLHFHNITEFTHLQYAWKNGARYYQGSYLGKANPDFLESTMFEKALKKDFHRFLVYERKKIQSQITLTDTLTRRLQYYLKGVDEFKDLDQLTKNIAALISDYSFRIYICDNEGTQQSGNALKDEKGLWQYREEEKFRNWSWRPYFLENIVRMQHEKKGILSDLYTDIHSDERIRTYSYPLNKQLYLFVDIPYSYLYEKDFLL